MTFVPLKRTHLWDHQVVLIMEFLCIFLAPVSMSMNICNIFQHTIQCYNDILVKSCYCVNACLLRMFVNGSKAFMRTYESEKKCGKLLLIIPVKASHLLQCQISAFSFKWKLLLLRKISLHPNHHPMGKD